jgi:hypothetical protein
MAKATKSIAPASKEEEIRIKYNAAKVYPLTAEVDGKKYEAWIRKPNRVELGAFMQLSQKNPIQATEVLLNSIFLEGDRDFIEDDAMFFGTMGEIEKIIEFTAVKLGK